jgi:hypothetical protein
VSAATAFYGYAKAASGGYTLFEPLRWEIGLKGSGWSLNIPAGFTFDSSVPRWLHWLVSPDHEPWLLAAAVHDYLLVQGHDKAFAAGEWYRAARAMKARDRLSWLVLPAYYGVVLWTVR